MCKAIFACFGVVCTLPSPRAHSMASERRPERLTSRQWSCSSLLAAIEGMDASELLAALPEDPEQIAKFIKDRIRGSLLS